MKPLIIGGVALGIGASLAGGQGAAVVGKFAAKLPVAADIVIGAGLIHGVKQIGRAAKGKKIKFPKF